MGTHEVVFIAIIKHICCQRVGETPGPVYALTPGPVAARSAASVHACLYY